MEKIPTVEDFIDDYQDEYFQGSVFGEFAYKREVVIQALKDFAKLHVKAALVAAAETGIKMYERSSYPWDEHDKKEILTAYTEENIK